jgi:hypothetical protein
MGQLGLGNGAFDSDMVNLTIILPTLPLVLKSMFEPLVIVRIVPRVGKVSSCCEGSWACCRSGGGVGFGSFLTWSLLVFDLVCDLQCCWRIGYLRNWQRLRIGYLWRLGRWWMSGGVVIGLVIS